MKKACTLFVLSILSVAFLGVLTGFSAGSGGSDTPPVPPPGSPAPRVVGVIQPVPRPLTLAVSVMDDTLQALPGALVTISQQGVDTLFTDSGGYAELPQDAVDHGSMTATIRHPAALRQEITFNVARGYDHFTLVYAVPLWRPEGLQWNDWALRTSNQLDVFQTGPTTITQPFYFDYANLVSRGTVSGYVDGPTPADAHAALVMRATGDAYLDGLTINVDTEGIFGDSVAATVVAVDTTGSPFPGLQVGPAPQLPGYPTAFTVTGTFPQGQPVVFLFRGQPVALAGGGGPVTTSSPCSSLPADQTNPDPDICVLYYTFSPQAQLLGCVGNCNGQSPRKGKFGGKVTGQVGAKVGVSAQGGGTGASLEISESGEVSGWFEEDYDVAPHTQRCWYLCSRETTWFCYDWLSEWFGFPPKVERTYSVGTDVVDTNC
jgi:hypothetical protein